MSDIYGNPFPVSSTTGTYPGSDNIATVVKTNAPSIPASVTSKSGGGWASAPLTAPKNGLEYLMASQPEPAPQNGLDYLMASKPTWSDAPKIDVPPAADVSPTRGFWGNTLDGIGMGMAAAGRGISNGIRSLGPEYNASADFFGLPSQADSAAAKVTDGPLKATWGGKLGNIAGNAALAAPMALVPGANTYAGASLGGALYGAATEDGDLMDRGRAALFGGAGGPLGQFIGKSAGAVSNALWNSSVKSAADQTAASAGKNAAATIAQDAGYVLPPSDVNPGMINTLLQGLSGKIKTAQSASERNQGITNDLTKADLGLPSDQPISAAALSAVRARAGQAYQAVGNSGTITPTPAYDAALDAIAAPYVKAVAGFPNAKPNPIIATIDSLRSPQFDAGSAVAKIGELRGAADTAFAQGDKQTGNALKAASGAIEDAIDTHLQATGAPPDLLSNFRNARQTIAQTYTAQKALNPVTGDINAQVLGQRVLAGKPVTGGMAQAGQVAAAYPRAMQLLKEVPNQMSPLDFAIGGMGVATGSPAAGLMAARPVVRSMILSKPYQRLLASPPTYTPSTGLGLLDSTVNSPWMQRAMTAGGVGGLLGPASQ